MYDCERTHHCVINHFSILPGFHVEKYFGGSVLIFRFLIIISLGGLTIIFRCFDTAEPVYSSLQLPKRVGNVNSDLVGPKYLCLFLSGEILVESLARVYPL